MPPDPIKESLLPAFAKLLFKGYVEKFGYSKASIDKHEMPMILVKPPKEFYRNTPEGKKTTCVSYFSEFKARGYLTQYEGFYKFTDAGFQFGYESLHPLKCFHKNHWKWLWGTVIIGLLIALATLLAGALSNPICTFLQNTMP